MRHRLKLRNNFLQNRSNENIKKRIGNSGITVSICQEEQRRTTTALFIRKTLLIIKGFGKGLPHFSWIKFNSK